MSNLDLLEESYENNNEKLFSIPEDAKYPIFDEGNALGIFRENFQPEQPPMEEDYFLGDSVHELRLSEDGAKENELNQDQNKKIVGISPKIEETHYEEHAVKNGVSQTSYSAKHSVIIFIIFLKILYEQSHTIWKITVDISKEK